MSARKGTSETSQTPQESVALPTVGNFTQVPNVFFDIWVQRLKNGSAVTVASIMIRQTEGWKDAKSPTGRRQTVSLGLRRIATLTGLNLKTVDRALATLKSHGLVSFDTRVGQRRSYAFSMERLENPEIPSDSDCTQNGYSSDSNCTQKRNSELYPKRVHVKERTSSKKEDLKESTASPSKVPTDSGIKPTEKPFRNGDDENLKLKAQPSPEGEVDSLLQNLRDAPKPTADHEARELTRKLIALGKESDVENAIRVLGRKLDRDGLWVAFWEKAKLTGSPQAVGGGHYTALAKNLATEVKTAVLKARTQTSAMLTLPKDPGTSQRCEKCGGGGYLSQTENCDCPMGLDLTKLEQRQQAKEATASKSALPIPAEQVPSLNGSLKDRTQIKECSPVNTCGSQDRSHETRYHAQSEQWDDLIPHQPNGMQEWMKFRGALAFMQDDDLERREALLKQLVSGHHPFQQSSGNRMPPASEPPKGYNMAGAVA